MLYRILPNIISNPSVRGDTNEDHYEHHYACSTGETSQLKYSPFLSVVSRSLTHDCINKTITGSRKLTSYVLDDDRYTVVYQFINVPTLV